MAINETWKIAPWADVLYACDERWWLACCPSETAFRGLRIIGEKEFPGCFFANVKHDAYRMIWDTDQIGSGGNGGFQALNLVARWGAKRVLLTGVDCRGSHWHGDHEHGLPNPKPSTQARWIESFNRAAPDLKRRGVEVINCSRDTALTCFPKARLEDVLK